MERFYENLVIYCCCVMRMLRWIYICGHVFESFGMDCGYVVRSMCDLLLLVFYELLKLVVVCAFNGNGAFDCVCGRLLCAFYTCEFLVD